MLEDALFEAVKGRRLGVVTALLPRVADLEHTDREGATVAMIAAREGVLPILKALLKAGANPLAADREGRSALHWAAANGHAPCIEALADAGADPNAQDREGVTPLMAALRARRSEAALRLLKCEGTDTELADRDGRKALDYASAASMPDLVDVLLKRGTHTERSEGVLGGFFGGVGGVEKEVPPELAKDRYGSNALHQAASRGDAETLARLLSGSRAHVNDRNDAGETPLMTAVRAGSIGCVEALLAAEADPNLPAAAGETPAAEAARLGREIVLGKLIGAGANVNAAARNGTTPLLVAIRERQVDVVRLLLANGADVGACDAQNRGPLAYAAASGLESVTVMLLEAGAAR